MCQSTIYLQSTLAVVVVVEPEPTLKVKGFWQKKTGDNDCRLQLNRSPKMGSFPSESTI